jgi:hypothetical protein
MLTGTVERRSSHHDRFKTELTMRFEKKNREMITAQITTINAQGIQFHLPWGVDLAEDSERLETVFNLPLIGQIRVSGEIHQLRLGIDTDLNRVVYYEIRFLNLSPEQWNYIYDYSKGKNRSEWNSPIPETAFHQERKDFRIAVQIPADFFRNGKAPVSGMVEDLSYGGIKATVPEEFSEAEEVKVTIHHAELTIELKGICVWCRSSLEERDSDQALIGVSFQSLDSDNFTKLRSLLFHAIQ